jgi:hypothetical protein
MKWSELVARWSSTVASTNGILIKARSIVLPYESIILYIDIYVCVCVYFSSRGPKAPKVLYWGTGSAELEKLEPIYTLITEYYWL